MHQLPFRAHLLPNFAPFQLSALSCTRILLLHITTLARLFRFNGSKKIDTMVVHGWYWIRIGHWHFLFLLHTNSIALPPVTYFDPILNYLHLIPSTDRTLCRAPTFRSSQTQTRGLGAQVRTVKMGKIWNSIFSTENLFHLQKCEKMQKKME